MSQSSGISIHSLGQGQFEDNDVYANELHGVMVQSQGKPSLSGNWIHDNRGSGFICYPAFGMTADDQGNVTQLTCASSGEGTKVNKIYYNEAGNIKVVDT